MPKRYWVYIHDEEGEIVDDVGNFDTLHQSIEAVTEVLPFDGERAADTIRIVDYEAQGQTVWLAGPVNEVNANSMIHKASLPR